MSTTVNGRRNTESTRSAIEAAAKKLFVEHGFGAVSLRDIAEEAAVTKSLIHHHFGSKDQLWQDVKAIASTDYAQRQQALLAAEPTLQTMHRILENHFLFLKDNQDLARIWCWAALEGDTSVGELDAELLAQAVELVSSAQASGQLRADLEPLAIVILFMSSCSMWFQCVQRYQGLAERAGLQPLSDQSYLENLLNVFFGGIAAKPLSGEPDHG